jgi:hypothetical protein
MPWVQSKSTAWDICITGFRSKTRLAVLPQTRACYRRALLGMRTVIATAYFEPTTLAVAGLILHSCNSISTYIAVLHKQIPSFAFAHFRPTILWYVLVTQRRELTSEQSILCFQNFNPP